MTMLTCVAKIVFFLCRKESLRARGSRTSALFLQGLDGIIAEVMWPIFESLDVQGGFDDRCEILLANATIDSYLDEYLWKADREKDEMARAGEDSQCVSRARCAAIWLLGDDFRRCACEVSR